MSQQGARKSRRHGLGSDAHPLTEQQEQDEGLEEGGPTGGSGSEAYAWHFDMLHDCARIDAFTKAFDRIPEKALQGDTVLDIGCGSGILGLTLLRRHPKLKQVIAIDVDATVADVARENSRRSGLAERLLVKTCRSTSLGSLADAGGGHASGARAALVVCEILDAGLLGEDCIGTLRHAAHNLLSDGYHAVPARAEVFACAVESSTISSWQHLRNDLDFAPKAFLQDEGDGNPHDIAFDRLLRSGQLRVLSKEFKALKVDFEQLPSGNQQVLLDVEVTQTGRVDAIVFWWQCFMVRGDLVPGMTNAPSWSKSAQRLSQHGEVDHWRQAVCVLPRPTHLVREGERLRIAAMHNDEDVWFRTVGQGQSAPPAVMPVASSHLSWWSQARMWMLADAERMHALQQAVHEAMRSLTMQPWQEHAGALVLDLSDGPLLSLAALKALTELSCKHHRRKVGPASKRLRQILRLSGRRPTVMCLEGTPDDLALAQDIILPHVQRLAKTSCANTNSAPRFELVEGSPMLSPQSVSAIVAEPFSRSGEGQPCDVHLWQHWAQVDALSWSLTDAAVLVPRRFRVLAVLVACPGLWKRRQPIADCVCDGVDVSGINRLHPDVLDQEARSSERRSRKRARSHAVDAFRTRFACSLWQVAHTVNGKPAVLCEVSLRDPMPLHRCTFEPPAALQIRDPSLGAHAVATWTEVEVSEGKWLHMGAPAGVEFEPSYNMQGLILARTPESQSKHVVVSAQFDSNDGSLRLSAKWDTGIEF